MPKKQSPEKQQQPEQLSLHDCRSMLMNAPIGIFSTSPDGRFIYANEYLARLFGYGSPREMMDAVVDIGKQIYADPQDRDTIRRLLEENEEELDFECRFVRRDQSTFWGSYNVRAVRNEKKSIVHYEGFLSDITKRTEEKESLLRTQFAMDRAPDSVLWIDDEGSIVYANDSSCASLGYTRDELLQMKVFDIDPDFVIDNWEQHKKDMEREGAMTFESRHRTKDGRIFPVEISTNRFGFNDFFLACAFDRDITERKRMEAALRESEEKYRTILDEMEEGYQEVDLAGNYTLFNDAFRRIYGYSKDEMMGTNFSLYIEEDTREKVYEAYNHMYKTGISIRNFVHDIIRKDGTRRTLEFNAFVLRDSDDRPIGFRGIGRDITERRQAEKALKKSEERFRALFMDAPIPLAQVTLDGKIVDLNMKFSEVLGYTLKDIPDIQQAWKRIYPDPEYRNRAISDWQIAISHATEQDLSIEPGEYCMVCKDGNVLTMIVGANVIGDTILVSFFDITELRRKEAELEQNIELLRVTFNATTDGILVVDKDLKVIQANQQFYQIWRIPPELQASDEDAALRASVLGQIGNSVAFQEEVNRLYQSREQGRYELPFKDGRVFECYTAPMMMEGGEIGRVWDFRDISEHRQAEDAAKESEARFRMLFTMSPFPLAHISRDGRILDVNDRLTEVMGYTIDDVPTLEQAWDLALPDAEMKKEITSKWREDLEDAIATYAGMEPLECPILCKDGTMRTMIVGTKLLEDSIIVSFFDLTDRIQAEQAIEFERQQLLSIFNSLNEIIYVSDPFTHELLFANRYLQDLIGKDPTGGLCYQELQLRDSPCDFCTNHIILNNNGLPHKWEFRNPSQKVDLSIVDQIIRWPDGRDVRLEFAEDVTERKRAERRLKDSESKLRSIFAAMKDVIMILDAEGHYLEIAPTNAEYLYRSPDGLIGKTVREVFPPEKADMFLDAIREALSRQKTVFLDYELTIGPREIWFATSVSPLSQDRVICVARDITEQKLLEDKFTTVFMMAPNVIAVTRMDDGMITEINVGFEEVTGWKRDEVIGRTSYDINFWVNPTDRVDMVDELQAGRDVLHHQMRFRRKDGSVLNGIYSARSIRIEGEDHILFVLQDVTEQQRTKKVLKEKEAQLRAITANIPGTIFQFYFRKDGEYGINYISQRITEIFGIDRTRDDLFECFVSSIHEDDRKRFLASVREAGERMSPWNFEGRFVKNGGTMWFHGRAMPTRHENRVVYDGFLVDITDRKRAEEEKEKLQDQLLQSQKLEAVGVLAGGVAHDFNNMLGAIMGYAELTMTKMDPANPFRENLDKILDTAQRSANLTRQLLAFARKQTIDPVVFDLSESVEGLLKMIRRLIGENIELAWFPGKGPSTVKMDPAQFDQILVNLCVNARDAITDVGKITIETDMFLCDEMYCDSHSYCNPGEYVLLAVSDDGSGMDSETLKHIFEPFFTTKELGRGTGLGLSTVYGIVKQNNGFINMYSEPGKGTTCKIYIPLHVVDVVKLPVATAEEIPRSRGETILIIEDEPTVLEMTTVMLQRLGYTVLAAGTPGEAIRIAEEHSSEIRLLITDVVMPEMNGRDLAERLRAIRPKMKTLFMSGYTANVIVHHGVLDEGVNFIQKPFSMKGMAAKIREALE